MDKEVVVHIHNGILSVIKRNKFAPVVVRWMNLEPSKQNKVRKRETNIYINTHIWNLSEWY